MLYLVGISISFFLSLLLFSKKNKSLADYILATWLFVMGFQLICFYLFITGNLFSYTWVIGFDLPIPIIHGPLLFLYTSALTGKIPIFKKKHLMHLMPALVEYLYLIPFFLLTPEKKIFVIENHGLGYENFVTVNSTAIIISGVGYVFWSMVLLKRHKRAIMDQFSDTDKINLNWLRYLIYGIAVIWIFVIINNDTLVFSCAVLFIVNIGYFGIRQVGIFTQKNAVTPQEVYAFENKGAEELEIAENDDPASEEEEMIIELPQKKYSKSGLNSELADELHKNLTFLMENEKLFKKSELTLAELATRLKTVPNYLSQIINEREGKNFYDYINTLRIEEFKKIASDSANQKYTLLGLAYDCGFNSKSSFNKYFKKITGVSPTEFLKHTQAA